MRRTWLVIAAAFVASLVVDLIVGADPPGLISAYGFVGCAVIVLASKWLGKVSLQVPPDYYEEEPAEDAAATGGAPGEEDRGA